METDVTIISTNISNDILNNYQDYVLVKDLSKLLNYQKVIFFLTLDNKSEREILEIYKLLKENNIKYINITNNIEHVLLTKYLKVYDKEKVLIEGNTIEVLKNTKLLKRLGLEIPFMVDLSLLLKDYNLVNDIFLDKEDLVDYLWE